MFINPIVSWLNSNDGAVMAILTFVYAVTTCFILKANHSAVKESRLAREAENRPYVIAYLQHKTNGIMNFVLKNTGKTAAEEVKLAFNEDIDFPEGLPLSSTDVVKNGVKTMPPGYEIKHLLGIGPTLSKDKEGKYPTYKVTISYYEIINKKKYSETYTLDFNLFNGSISEKEYEIHDLVKEVKSINKNLK